LGENARAAVEMQRRANDMRNTRSRPKRRASHDVGNARDPINRSGMVVRSEAVAWERPNSFRMDGKIGPMETIAGRRSMATNTIARIASRLCMAFGSPPFSLTSGLAIISVVISLLLITLRDSFNPCLLLSHPKARISPMVRRPIGGVSAPLRRCPDIRRVRQIGWIHHRARRSSRSRCREPIHARSSGLPPGSSGEALEQR